jgi:hypothetical protein
MWRTSSTACMDSVSQAQSHFHPARMSAVYDVPSVDSSSCAITCAGKRGEAWVMSVRGGVKGKRIENCGRPLGQEGGGGQEEVRGNGGPQRWWGQGGRFKFKDPLEDQG